MQMKSITLALIACMISCTGLLADEKNPTEEDFYPIVQLPIPPDAYLEVGGLEWMPDDKLAVSSRRGDIYMVDGALYDAAKIGDAEFTKYAGGLHEVLGLSLHDGALYATQRGEITKLIDTDKDGRADLHETVSDGWEINGDYHEYAFGSKFDPDGHMWIVLCLTGSFNSNCKYRGWCVRVTPNGKMIPTCSGIRSPGGIGMNSKGEVFYCDNQGPWNGTSGLKHLAPGSFQGHPGGNRWFDQADALAGAGPRPKDPQSGSRMVAEAKKIPELMPTVIMFPHDKMGKSASGIVCDNTNGKFGPFRDQLFVGDQSFSTVRRVFLEKINGRYQGAAFPFRASFGSGTLAMLMHKDGKMFVGGTNRGWGSRGNKPYALERMDWTGKLPFEIHEMRAKPDGFELTFTMPIDPQAAANLDSYKISTFTYIYQSKYGSPEVDHTTPKVLRAEVGKKNRSVRLYIDKLQEGHIHALHTPGVRSASGLPVLHPVGYYTLNSIPQS
jgi:glucose/arabinose dehydrogenase